MEGRTLLAMGLLIAAGEAAGTESLWCRVQSGDLPGVSKATKITAFAWDGAHGGVRAKGAIKTSIGTFDRGEGADATTAITIDGKAVPLSPGATGVIWNGKTFDFGGKVAVVFLVETATDSSASPSEALILIGRGPSVLEQGVISGQETAPNRCPLL